MFKQQEKTDWPNYKSFGWITHWSIINENEHHVIQGVLEKKWFMNMNNNYNIPSQ